MVDKTTFTLSEAAGLLSCHTETLRRAIKSGALSAAKLGKGYRISKTDLEVFWQKQGGGALFEDSPQARKTGTPTETEPAPRQAKKQTGPEQLKLPT
ncbi:MAG: helix-turn-helix domain-containing protein [Desulfovibrionaceae bacterium]